MEDKAREERDRTIDEAIQLLPPEIQDQVRDFIGSLLSESDSTAERKPELDWKGALRDLREQHTAVELQHKALEWW